ncbi:MAG: cell wall-binding protein [Lachnoclostridium sp.]|nr:cell wall-binding protein [Lachnoclostridium sp.]
MRKKGFKVLTLAMMLTIGAATMSVYAAEGWTMSNNAWTYLDAKGNKVRDEWRKGADNLWRYLNYKGEMAISTWVDDEYYVDSNGIMVSNQWVKTKPQYDSNAEDVWFYFGSSGKMAKDGWKKIDGKNYLFDDEGAMQTGWTEDGLYYLGEDGAVKTGWKYLAEPEEDDLEWETEYAGPESADGKYWFYFGSNGKKYCPESSGSDDLYKVVKISGDYYCFDEEGRMMTGWVYLPGDAEKADSDSIEGWRYFAESGIANVTLGATVKGWLSLVPPDAIQNEIGDDVVWYYFSANGTPEAGPEYGNASTNDFKRINGKSYLFDAMGNPVSGLHKVQIAKTGEYTSYYFDPDSKLAITGKETIEEADGTESTFYFNEGSYAGRGYTGVKNNYLYYMGKRQQAEDGMKYAAITLDDDGEKKTYVVNESGRIQKNKEVKDDDGTKFKTDANGILTHVDGKEVGSKVFEDPIEPVFEE